MASVVRPAHGAVPLGPSSPLRSGDRPSWHLIGSLGAALVLRLAVIVVLLGLSPAATTERAFACDCTPARAAGGVRGRRRGLLRQGPSPSAVTFPLTSRSTSTACGRGPEASEIVVTTFESRVGRLRLPLRAGREYLVYAFDEALAVWLCGGTVPLQYAQDEVALLDAGQPGGAGVADSGRLPWFRSRLRQEPV